MNSAGIVLCGGKSTRMGTSKALLDFGGETMLQRVVRLLGAVTSPIVVVAAADQALPPLPPAVTIARDEQEAQGPLEGLRVGLQALPETVDVAYVTSCDVPFLVPAFAQRMIELAADADVAVIDLDGLPQPLSAAYRRRTVLPEAVRLLTANRRRLTDLFDMVRTRHVSVTDVADVDSQLMTLRNLNSMDDYRKARVMAGLASDADPS
jgi:molybdenum cofactor guanylyltransferase